MRHKTTTLRIILTALLLGAFGLVIAGCGKKEEKTPEPTTQATTAEPSTGVDYTKMISAEEVKGGAAFGDLTMGNPDAPLTVIEYASLTCPHCARFDRDTFPAIMEKYIKTGKVKWIYRNFTRDRLDLEVALVTRCYGPDKAFDLMTIYFDTQQQWEVQDPLPQIAAIARQKAGIDRVDFDRCRANAELQQNMVDLRKMGQEAGVNATPTFIIGDDRVVGESSIEEMSKVIDDNL